MAPPPADYALYYVTGRALLPPGKDYYESLEEACQGGVTLVQVREKSISTRAFLEIATKSKAVCDKYNVPLLINDRLDIALAVGCGLHVGQDDMPAPLARKLLGPDFLLGVSVNTEEEMRIVLEDHVVDYIGVGPVYTTASKKDLNPVMGTRGVTRILGVLGDSHIKVVAIGGITAETIPNVLAQCSAPLPSGAYRSLDGLAVISAIAASPTPSTAAASLLTLFRAAPLYPSLSHSSTNSPALLISAACALLSTLRQERNPLIHHITNYVVMNDCANVTLALGGSPIMSALAGEAPELSRLIGALLLNFGTLSAEQVNAQTVAGIEAKRNGRMVVFDPVGVGATKYRRESADELLSVVHMSIIKGNAGEIGALAGSSEVGSRGVDSVGSGFKDPATIVRDLARREKLVVAMSGAVDYVSDGNVTFAIDNGHHYQAVITGSGCMASTSVATFASVADDFGPLIAAVTGLVAINVAAEIAGERDDVRGPSTFRAALIDECYRLTPEVLRARARIRLL